MIIAVGNMKARTVLEQWLRAHICCTESKTRPAVGFKPTPSHTTPTRPPKQSTNWETNIQIYDSIGALQTTTLAKNITSWMV